MGNWKIRQRIPSDKEFTEADRRVNDLNSSKWQKGDITKWNELNQLLTNKYYKANAKVRPAFHKAWENIIKDDYDPKPEATEIPKVGLSAAAETMGDICLLYKCMPKADSTDEAAASKAAEQGKQVTTTYWLPIDEVFVQDIAAGAPAGKVADKYIRQVIIGVKRAKESRERWVALEQECTKFATDGQLNDLCNFLKGLDKKAADATITKLNKQGSWNDEFAAKMRKTFDTDDKVRLFCNWWLGKDARKRAPREIEECQQELLVLDAILAHGNVGDEVWNEVIVQVDKELGCRLAKIKAKIDHLHNFSIGRKTLEIDLSDI